MNRIYLDHAATTPLCLEAREAMMPWLGDRYGNPSSMHEEGRQARAAIDDARETVADALGCRFAEVVFTSCGTEAANLAILGAAATYREYRRPRVLMSAVEHHCVLHTVGVLEGMGYRVELVPVDRAGRMRLDVLEGMLGQNVLLVCVMHANNELGTIQPVAEVAELAHGCGALFFCDAVQTFQALPDARAAMADLVSVSAHKIHGPKGVGALFIRAGVKLKPLILGGGQERELRAGTENVAGIVGFAAAIKAGAVESTDRKRAARDRFLEKLAELAPEGLYVTVPDREAVLPGHAHIRYGGISAESMLIVLDMAGVAASSGAACSSGSLEASHVLKACGYSEAESKEGLRFTFGREATVGEAEAAAVRVARAVRQIRRPAGFGG